MDDTTKIVGMVVGALLLVAVVAGSCVAYDITLDARAPVVESCVKHPATRSPFRGAQ